MKKWIYFIVPILGLGVFLGFYFTHVEEAKRVAAERKIAMARKAEEEAMKKKELENKAREDAERLAAERAAAEAKKLKERADAQAAEDKKVKDATDRALGECEKFTDQIAKSEREISLLRAAKEKDNREYLELSKQLELARIDRRNAELEVQRMTENVARKASSSAIANFTPPVLPKK